MPRWPKDAEASLRASVLALACEQPIGAISVAQLSQRAGITRDTFYRYASRPVDVLARALAADLPTLAELVRAMGSGPADDPVRPAGGAILAHVERNREIYRRALRPHLDPELRDVLVHRIEEMLARYLDVHRHVLPALGSGMLTERERYRFIVFTAAGVVGAIEDWVSQEEPEPVERMLDLLFAVAAPWWRPLTGGA
jgi:AcrR family transcriptional regulator